MKIFKPRSYQRRIIRELCSWKRRALFVDMGLGKTVCILTAMLKRGWRPLVVAPKLVCQTTWPDEIRKWKHTRHIPYLYLTRNMVDMGWLTLRENGDQGITAISYDNFPYYQNSLEKHCPFDTIIFDESSKMKAPTSQRMKAAKKIIHHFKRRYILTGTPSAEGYEGLWSQIYLLDDGRRLGEFVSYYRSNYFMRPPHGFGYQLQLGAKAIIESKIQDIVLTLKSEDYVKLPPISIHDILVDLPPRAKREYKRMEKELFMLLDRTRIDAANAGVKSIKCRQAASGYVYDDAGMGFTLHQAKLDALQTIVEEAQGEPVLVAWQFRTELRAIQAAFPHAVEIGRAGAIERWNKRQIPMLLAHPASAGHGLNLQDGGHIVVWFSLTYSCDQYQQLHKRLHRPGQLRPVMSYRLMARGTIDRAVAQVLENKADEQEGLLNALIRYRDETMK